jgi:pimeloyl-ACP methyl ester carboxylesterase
MSEQRVTPRDLDYRRIDQHLAFVRKRNESEYAIRSPRGISERRYVMLGGIPQWITIRGQDRSNPVLLFVHGGPGDVTSCWGYAVFAPWERQFTVVQWDQRGAGRTLRKSGPAIAKTLTVDRMARDGVELAVYLHQRFGKKIVVVAHSFGTLLAVQMVQRRPDLFVAYVGTGQVADEPRNYSAAYDALLAKARSVRNQQALKELTEIGPPPYSSYVGYGVQRNWSNAFEGSDWFLAGTLVRTIEAPGCSPQDAVDSDDGQLLSGQTLFSQTRSMGPKQLGLRFAVPMFFFQGAEDFSTPTALALEYFREIRAPRKAFIAIPHGGHFSVFIHSDTFLHELVTRVRPLAGPP